MQGSHHEDGGRTHGADRAGAARVPGAWCEVPLDLYSDLLATVKADGKQSTHSAAWAGNPHAWRASATFRPS